MTAAAVRILKSRPFPAVDDAERAALVALPGEDALVGEGAEGRDDGGGGATSESPGDFAEGRWVVVAGDVFADNAEDLDLASVRVLGLML